MLELMVSYIDRNMKGLTPAVRGDYAKHNCPFDQYVRLTADATMVVVGLLIILMDVALDV